MTVESFLTQFEGFSREAQLELVRIMADRLGVRVEEPPPSASPPSTIFSKSGQESSLYKVTVLRYGEAVLDRLARFLRGYGFKSKDEVAIALKSMPLVVVDGITKNEAELFQWKFDILKDIEYRIEPVQ